MASASKWATARTLTLTGSVTGSVSIDGSGNVTLATTTNHTHSYAASPAVGGAATWLYGKYTGNGGQQKPNYFGSLKIGGLMMNTTINGNSQYKDFLIMDCYSGTDAGGAVAFGVNRQTLGAYIMRSAAERTAWAESAELIGTHNYTTYTVKKDGTGASGTWGISITGNAATASKWETARTLTLSGSVTGSVSIDGSGNVTLATTTNHTHTFASLTSKPTTISGYGITDAKIVNGVITLGTATITPVTSVAIASGTNNGTLKLTVNGSATDNIAVKGLGSAAFTASSAYAAASHTHSLKINGSTKTIAATGGTAVDLGSYLPLSGGTMTGTINANDGAQNTGIKFKSNNANLNALSNQHLILGTAIRFGAYGTWDWDAWAGLKYDSSSKTIYLGIADGTVFNANEAQTGGTLSLPAISTVKVDANTRIAQASGNLYLGSSSNTGWLFFQDMASQRGTEYWNLTQNGYLTAKGVTLSETFTSSVSSGTYLDANDGTAIINSTAAAGFNMLARMKSTNGVFIHGVHNDAYCFYYTTDSVINAGTNTSSKQYFRLNENGYIYSNDLLPLGTNNIGSYGTRWSRGYFINNVHVGPNSTEASAGGANSGVYGNGYIELSHSTPYIDFHYAQSTADYTSRIMATAADCLAISSHLYVGGAGATNYTLRVDGSAYTQGFSSQGKFAILDGSGNATTRITQAGNMVVSGGITMYSDVRKKDIISDKLLSVKSIADAPLFAFNYKSDEAKRLHTGTSAQYWHGAYGDMFGYKDDEGYYTLEYQNLGVAMGISLAREIVKYESKTDKKIRLMKKKINDLEARIKELEGSMEERRTA